VRDGFESPQMRDAYVPRALVADSEATDQLPVFGLGARLRGIIIECRCVKTVVRGASTPEGVARRATDVFELAPRPSPAGDHKSLPAIAARLHPGDNLKRFQARELVC
jgi:hypothetical protein